jgi:hypothetical protein
VLQWGYECDPLNAAELSVGSPRSEKSHQRYRIGLGIAQLIAFAAMALARSNRKMGILAMSVLAMWFLVALATGLALGAMIRKADRIRKDDFLADLFLTLETLQHSSPLNHKALLFGLGRISPEKRDYRNVCAPQFERRNVYRIRTIDCPQRWE